MEFFLTIGITIFLLFSFSIYFYKKKHLKQFIIPIAGILLSLLLIILSFFIGAWEGMGLGFFGFAIFIGSAVTVITIAIIHNTKDLKNHYYH